MSSKRSLGDAGSTTKRTRMPAAPNRLCDLADGVGLFMSKHNGVRAKEKGYIRSREASTKYAEIEKRLFQLYKDSGDLDFPDEDWVFEVLPELRSLEDETLDALLVQAQTHAKYERAARELVLAERKRLEAEHEHEIRGLRAHLEGEAARTEVSAEFRIKQAESSAKEDTEELRKEAVEKIASLEECIEELEEKLEAKQKEYEDLEAEAREECERLREEGEAVVQQLEEFKGEAEAKRETSKKLKEEIIDNDRLTVANLNRIKLLESEVNEHRAALQEAEGENEELRKELSRSVSGEEVEEGMGALRELLAEREKQIMSLSRRLSDASDMTGMSGRRDSFLDRLGSSMKAHMASSSA